MWEFPVMIFLLLIAYVSASIIKRRMIGRKPEYKYFVWGLMTKVMGGILFACIYVFYYGGGDTTSYYECSMTFSRLLVHDFSDFLIVLFGDGTQEMKSYFTTETGEPLMYMFAEGSTRFTMKLLIPFMLVTGNSYFLTTVLVAIFTYGGLWQLFRMFVRHFPQHTRRLAIAILFMPSVLFWGSGILKDSFTLAATCYLIVAINNLIEHRGLLVMNIIKVLLFGLVVISIKAYVIVILLPSTLVWMFYNRMRKIKNVLIRQLIVPIVYVVILAGSYFGLTALGESLGKFSVDNALKTAAVNQFDLKQEYYEGNSFDIGDFDPTVTGALSKFVPATLAGLFRPYLWDCKNVVMLLSGLENFFVLLLTIVVLMKMRWRMISKFVIHHPLLLYCLVFSILFSFMIGLTSPNFGALVRFRLPLIPLYMACLMIIYGELEAFKRRRNSGMNQKRFATVPKIK